jgi:signal transduction histidine kinase
MKARVAFPRLRSGASVDGMSDAHGVDVRGIVMVRLGGYASILALITGLGLFFLAGIRDAQSWGWFIVAALGGVLGAVWSGRSALASEAVGGWPKDGEPRAVDSTSSTGSALLDVASSVEVRSEPEDVDSLMALRHEFRTPLNAVLGFSDVLLSGIDGEVNDSQREDLEIIRASGIRLRILLDSAFDLSQLASGELRLNVERTDVRELMARVAGEAGQLWANKRTVACTLPEEPCVTEADETRLRRSILVLADFLATDHREANIALSLALSEDHLAIQVTSDSWDPLTLAALPTPAEVLASEDATEICRWPVAVTSEVITRHEGSLYHGDAPSRFLIRLPLRGER